MPSRLPSRLVQGILLLVLGTLPAAAQLGPGPFAAFPTANETDGRFLGFGCPGLATFEAGVSITLSAGPGETDFTLNVFDGDTTGTSPTGHWDVGTRQLLYKLYFDPFRQGNTDPADLVGQWTGNAANPLTNPIVDPDRQWSVSAAVMPDNDWWGVTILTSALAQAAPGSNFFYHLRIDADGACIGTEQLEANIKVAASAPLSFAAPRFAFVAALRQIANDRPIIYPGTLPPPSLPPPGGFVIAPTTFDGTFTFAVNIPPGTTELDIFDGDFDFGTNPALLLGTPSLTPLFACADTDDANTPNDYSDFPPALDPGIGLEGAGAFGAPPDDINLDLFRRGELGAAGRVGCVRYEVTDPQGGVYRNDDPSGNVEWERFRIISQNDPNAAVPGSYDELVESPFLPPGTWKVRIVALDMSNLNFFFVQAGVCSNIENEQAFAELDFERDGAGNSLADETLIAEQWASQGIHFATNDPVLHPLRILNSANPTFDPELGTPNEDFGGPGVGAGGGLGQPGENSLEQGNILIITQSVEVPPSDFPGTVFVTFDAPRNVEEVHLVDIDGDGGTVAAFNAAVGGSLLGSFPISNLGENSFQVLAVQLLNVRRLEIVLPTGGGIARITSGEDFVTNCPPPVFAVGDTVWFDTNGTGSQAPGEVGISGVLMELLAAGNPTPIATAITGDDTNPSFNLCQRLNTTLNPGDEAGLYCFLVPPGEFTVRVAASNFDVGGPLSGLASTTGGETQTDTVVNTNILTYDFGYRGAGSLGDRVWLDTNGDGVQDGGETGINGVTVELRDGDGNLVDTQVTAGDGDYLFENLPPGDYTVTVVSSTLPAGVDPTFDRDGIATAHTAEATLAANENRTDVDFGYRGTASLGDRVWLDTSGDGVQDGGEAGINGVTVRLLDGGGNLVATQVTAGDGLYSFTGLGAGTYTVEVVAATLPAGLTQTYDLDSLATPHRATAGLAAAQNRTDVDFGYRLVQVAGKLGDRVWFDNNGNGLQDGAGEPGINGVTVRLLDGGGNLVATQVTAGDGLYSFTGLAAGTYTVEVVAATLPAGLTQTYDLDSLATPHRATAGLAAAQNRTDVDFGYRPVQVCSDGFAFDRFDVVSFSNNNGTFNWTGSWIESDVAGAGPSAGNIKVWSNALKLKDAPDTGTEPSGAREVNLSGATSATLTFNYSTSAGVDTSDSVVVEISKDGGSTYTVLETFTNLAGATSGSRSYNITSSIASNTRVRFRVKASYGGDDEWFLADNVKVTRTCSSACTPKTFQDNFDVESFSNNNGSHNWSAAWVESDVAGAGPTAGGIKVWSNALKLKDAPDTGTEPSAAREANLSGALTASLSFKYSTSAGVDTSDSVVVEISKDGGATYTVLETFTNLTGATSGTRSYDISGSIASNTRVRFRVKASYGGDDEWFLADNVKISTGCDPCAGKTFEDKFNTVSFSNNNGSHNWSAAWVENDVAGAGPSEGGIKVWSNALKLKDSPDTGTEPSAAREANLSGATAATLSFSYSTASGVDTSDSVVVEISKDGGATYTVLETFTNLAGATSGTRSYNISGSIASNTRVRFRVKANYGADDEWFLADNVKITTSCVASLQGDGGPSASR